jgi:hypothetical protein
MASGRLLLALAAGCGNTPDLILESAPRPDVESTSSIRTEGQRQKNLATEATISAIVKPSITTASAHRCNLSDTLNPWLTNLKT